MPGVESGAGRFRWLAAMALALFGAWIVAEDASMLGIGFFFAIPIGLATWWAGWQGGLAATIGCLALMIAAEQINPEADFLTVLLTRAVVFAGVVGLVSMTRDRILALEGSADELEALRAALTPAALPEIADVDAAAVFTPSELGVSGDFYLLTNGPDGSVVAVVGDVVGHGPKAAQLATFIRARFAALAANTNDPVELLKLANTALLDRRSEAGELVSAVGIALVGGTELSCAVAGHPPLIRLPALRELAPAINSLPLGADPGLDPELVQTTLEPGEGVLAYTDGAVDVRQSGVALGIEGLAGFLGGLAHLPARELTDKLAASITSWADKPLRDDLCLLAMKPRAS